MDPSPEGNGCGTVSPMARIEDYALVGDLHTAALISTEGSIDWLCLPRFDSPACFNALLDTPRAGRWLLAPEGGGECTRQALPQGHPHPGNRVGDALRKGQGHRLHASPRRGGGHRADRGGHPRHGQDARRADPAFRLRPHRALGPPRRARDPRRRRSRCRVPGDRGAAAGRAPADHQRLHRQRRGPGAVRADLDAEPPAPAPHGGPGSGPWHPPRNSGGTGQPSARSPGPTARPCSAR